MTENTRKSKRSNAGVNSKHDENYVWSHQQEVNQTFPKVGSRNEELPQSKSAKCLDGVGGRSENSDGARSRKTRCTSRGSGLSKNSGREVSKMSSNKRTEIERKRLALKTERARELLMRKQELDNEMSILQLKQELAEAVLVEDADSSSDNENKEDIMSMNSEGENTRVENWIESCEYALNTVTKSEELADIDKLCNVIAEAIKTVSISKNKEISPEFLCRQVMDKEFPRRLAYIQESV
ncbi:hypothetical protein JTB14_019077 [Gonioctena quinquepunctata]|nr:hypothetical protein JTB14_019077 [Gonioctena quinquepunctata]